MMVHYFVPEEWDDETNDLALWKSRIEARGSLGSEWDYPKDHFQIHRERDERLRTQREAEAWERRKREHQAQERKRAKDYLDGLAIHSTSWSDPKKLFTWNGQRWIGYGGIPWEGTEQ